MTSVTEGTRWRKIAAGLPWGHLVVCATWAGLGAASLVESENLGYDGKFGPGAGFFLRYLGWTFLGLSTLIASAACRSHRGSPNELNSVALSGPAVRRFAFMAAALVTFPLVAEFVNLPAGVAVAAFAAFLTHQIKLVWSLLGTLAITGALVFVFHYVLGVLVF